MFYLCKKLTKSITSSSGVHFQCRGDRARRVSAVAVAVGRHTNVKHVNEGQRGAANTNRTRVVC